jgi:hypothetical protein
LQRKKGPEAGGKGQKKGRQTFSAKNLSSLLDVPDATGNLEKLPFGELSEIPASCKPL